MSTATPSRVTPGNSGHLDRLGNLATLPAVQTNGVDVYELSEQCRQRWEIDRKYHGQQSRPLVYVGQGDQQRHYHAADAPRINSTIWTLAVLCLAMVVLGIVIDRLLAMFFG